MPSHYFIFILWTTSATSKIITLLQFIAKMKEQFGEEGLSPLGRQFYPPMKNKQQKKNHGQSGKGRGDREEEGEEEVLDQHLPRRHHIQTEVPKVERVTGHGGGTEYEYEGLPVGAGGNARENEDLYSLSSGGAEDINSNLSGQEHDLDGNYENDQNSREAGASSAYSTQSATVDRNNPVGTTVYDNSGADRNIKQILLTADEEEDLFSTSRGREQWSYRRLPCGYRMLK